MCTVISCVDGKRCFAMISVVFLYNSISLLPCFLCTARSNLPVSSLTLCLILTVSSILKNHFINSLFILESIKNNFTSLSSDFTFLVKSPELGMTWNNRLVPNRKRSLSRLYIVTLFI